MGQLLVARRATRQAIYLPMAGTKLDPSILIMMTPKSEQSELDDLVRAMLKKHHVTDEKEVQALVANAEQGYEERIQLQEARKELRRLMKIKANGGKLMQRGFRKWQQCFYPAVIKET